MENPSKIVSSPTGKDSGECCEAVFMSKAGKTFSNSDFPKDLFFYFDSNDLPALFMSLEILNEQVHLLVSINYIFLSNFIISLQNHTKERNHNHRDQSQCR